MQIEPTYPQIDIKEFKAFAVWRWKAEELNQNCCSCRKLMTEPCIDCEVINDQMENQSKCIAVQSGNCGHALHRHCIRKWIQTKSQGGTQGTCPMCDLTWEITNEVELQN
ncbi:unnamed protein product [Paramecium sonneborni]|uniref:RING-type domain-containing protein n=1 Tax=Paramecium sonneborni TaxID=65129 RepID=A0A8S1Q5U2_9CILI|nr:unnamed protein product [Paramecium sonneborni]